MEAVATWTFFMRFKKRMAFFMEAVATWTFFMRFVFIQETHEDFMEAHPQGLFHEMRLCGHEMCHKDFFHEIQETFLFIQNLMDFTWRRNRKDFFHETMCHMDFFIEAAGRKDFS
jgi:hypothetical protein